MAVSYHLEACVPVTGLGPLGYGTRIIHFTLVTHQVSSPHTLSKLHGNLESTGVGSHPDWLGLNMKIFRLRINFYFFECSPGDS